MSGRSRPLRRGYFFRKVRNQTPIIITHNKSEIPPTACTGPYFAAVSENERRSTPAAIANNPSFICVIIFSKGNAADTAERGRCPPRIPLFSGGCLRFCECQHGFCASVLILKVAKKLNFYPVVENCRDDALWKLSSNRYGRLHNHSL